MPQRLWSSALKSIFLLHRTPTDYKGIFSMGQHQNESSPLPERLFLWGRNTVAGETMRDTADSKHAWPIAHIHREFLKSTPKAGRMLEGQGWVENTSKSHGNLSFGSGAGEFLLPSASGGRGEARSSPAGRRAGRAWGR